MEPGRILLNNNLKITALKHFRLTSIKSEQHNKSWFKESDLPYKLEKDESSPSVRKRLSNEYTRLEKERKTKVAAAAAAKHPLYVCSVQLVQKHFGHPI